MVAENNQTEELIRETAKRVFFQKGHLNATTQEIADEAGVNRALIHYYFRSRDLLFEKVLDEVMGHRMKLFGDILQSKEPFKFKISRFLDGFIEQNVDYPYIENFIVTEMVRCPENIKKYNGGKKKLTELLEKQLKAEIKAGRIAPIKIEHFITNLVALCNYPMVGKPIIQTIFQFDETAYRKFLLERKQVVFRILFNEDPPEG